MSAWDDCLRADATVTAARTLTDADMAALREAMRDVVREEIGHAREALTDRPANSRARAPLTVSETTSEAARRELERRGLRAPREHRGRRRHGVMSPYREPPHAHRWRLLPGLAWRCSCCAADDFSPTFTVTSAASRK